MASFNAKNLTYDKSEPAFLQRLKAGYAAQDGRNNVQHARPVKSRLKMDDDEEDGPVILDERGEVVDTKVYEGMLNNNNDERPTQPANANGDKDGKVANDGEQQQQKAIEAPAAVVVGATAKKRKAVKAVIDDEPEAEYEGVNRTSKPSRKGHSDDNDDDNESSQTKAKAVKKPVKKTKKKKVKLSFDDEADDPE